MQIEAEKRLVQAISGEKPDRVPTSPLFFYFAGRQAGFTTAEILTNPRSYRDAMDYCWEHFGPWDAYYPLNAINRTMMHISMMMKTAYPGDELPEDESVQFLEEELMVPEDYDLMLEPLLPLDIKKMRKAFRRALGDWLRRRREEMSEKGIAGAIAAAREKLPDFFKTAYGNPRDQLREIRGHIEFTKKLTELFNDPSLDTGLAYRYMQFMLRLAARARGETSKLDNILDIFFAAYEQLDFSRDDFAAWRERGVATLYGMGMEGPFDSFSMSRSMIPFTTDDLFVRPEKVKQCADNAVDFIIVMAELGRALTGIPRFIHACHRTSNDFISPTHFRELAFPAMLEVTERLAERGIALVFHCDGKWDHNLEILAGLPEGSCVFQFDGRTDIFLARKVLGDGHCIFGDVPAMMLARGSEAEVAAYCKRLINEVGAPGRFILGAGCEVPPDAKPENVKAMLRAPFEE
ncbi:MAG: uroporphyrinogen decarboxylase family protein [bacterium]